MLHNNDEYFFDKVEIKRTTSYLNTIRIFFGNQCKELELYILSINQRIILNILFSKLFSNLIRKWLIENGTIL